MKARPNIAVLALQGDYVRHMNVLTRLGTNAYLARFPEDIMRADAIVLPGGESTTIGKMMARYGVDIAIQDAGRAGKPVYGTCAGLILLSREIKTGTDERGGQPTLGLLDAVVARNAFGRQVDSFEASVDVPVLGTQPLRAVFIRAPYVVWTGPDVETLATHEGKIVYVRQGSVVGSAFHPELTDDPRAHEFFLSLLAE